MLIHIEIEPRSTTRDEARSRMKRNHRKNWLLLALIAIGLPAACGGPNTPPNGGNTGGGGSGSVTGGSTPDAGPDAPSDTVEWPEVKSEIPQDAAIEAAIADLLAKMTLEQKVGQMVQAEIKAIKPEEVKQYHIGSVLNGGGSWPNNSKEATAQDWLALADAYYAASTDTSGGAPGEHLGIPVLWGTDAVHGHSNVKGATLFPHNITPCAS
jgi:beta-glucosidase